MSWKVMCMRCNGTWDKDLGYIYCPYCGKKYGE